MQRIGQILITTMLVLLCQGLVRSAHAQACTDAPIEYIQGQLISDITLEPIADCLVEFYDLNGTLLDYVVTDGNGYWQVNDAGSAIVPDNYLLKFNPHESWSMIDNGRYAPLEVSEFVTYSHPSCILEGAPPTQYIDLGQQQLPAQPKRVKLTVQQSTSPPTGASGIELIALDNDGYWFGTRTNSDGVAYFPVTTERYLEIFGNSHIFEPILLNVAVGNGPETSVTRTVRPPGNATLNVQLFDENQQSLALPAGGWGFVECQDVLTGGEYFVFLSEGEFQGTMTVRSGEYECYVTVNDYYVQRTRVTIAPHETKSAPVQLVSIASPDSTAEVTLTAVDESTHLPLDGGCLSIAVFSTASAVNSIDFFDVVETTTGNLFLELPAGIEYGADVSPCSSESEIVNGGTRYVAPRNVVSFTPTVDGSNSVELVLSPLSSTLTVLLRDQFGNPVDGWVEAESQGSLENATAPVQIPGRAVRSEAIVRDARDHWTGVDSAAGEATLRLLPGRRYYVTAYPSAQGGLLPERRELTLQAGEHRVIAMTVPSANHSVIISPQFPAGTGDSEHGFVGCFGFNQHGQETYAEGKRGEPVVLPIGVSPGKNYWRVGCHAIGGVLGQERFYVGMTVIVPKFRSPTTEVVLRMITEGAFYPQECREFRADRSKTFVLADGLTRLEIPVGAFGDSGIVSMCSESGKGYTFSDDEYPTLSFDISFYKDGVKLPDPMKSVNIWFPINMQRLAELGASPDDLIAGSFHDRSKTWRRDASSTIKTLDGVLYLVVPVRHFSIWGTLVSVSKALKKKYPTYLKVKRLKKKTNGKAKVVLLKWTPPEGAPEEQLYDVEIVKLTKKIRKYQKKGGDIFDRAKRKETTGTQLRRRLKPGKYRFRVRVKDGAFPDPRAFRVAG